MKTNLPGHALAIALILPLFLLSACENEEERKARFREADARRVEHARKVAGQIEADKPAFDAFTNGLRNLLASLPRPGALPPSPPAILDPKPHFQPPLSAEKAPAGNTEILDLPTAAAILGMTPGPGPEPLFPDSRLRRLFETRARAPEILAGTVPAGFYAPSLESLQFLGSIRYVVLLRTVSEIPPVVQSETAFAPGMRTEEFVLLQLPEWKPVAQGSVRGTNSGDVKVSTVKGTSAEGRLGQQQSLLKTQLQTNTRAAVLKELARVTGGTF